MKCVLECYGFRVVHVCRWTNIQLFCTNYNFFLFPSFQNKQKHDAILHQFVDTVLTLIFLINYHKMHFHHTELNRDSAVAQNELTIWSVGQI